MYAMYRNNTLANKMLMTVSDLSSFMGL